jgi:NADPH:quinone reductase-like Zn-dependent oxidoreductase
VTIGAIPHEPKEDGQMPRAVRFDHYGDVDVLYVAEVDRPVPGPGQVLVRVKAAGINPGEASVRKVLVPERWPATFSSGEGCDPAAVVEDSARGRTVLVRDEVIGFTDNRDTPSSRWSCEEAHL